MDIISYVGLDVHRATVRVALAESGRGGELRQLGYYGDSLRKGDTSILIDTTVSVTWQRA
jgi:hypothetical protein